MGGRSQWPRGLRRRSTAAHLLRLRVRIPPWAWMSVCCECCALSGRGLCDELITRPEESYRLWCVVVCDLETSWMSSLGAVALDTNKQPGVGRESCRLLNTSVLDTPVNTLEHSEICQYNELAAWSKMATGNSTAVVVDMNWRRYYGVTGALINFN